jgi:hypothetical protein
MSNDLAYHASLARTKELRRQAAGARQAAELRASAPSRKAWIRLARRRRLPAVHPRLVRMLP